MIPRELSEDWIYEIHDLSTNNQEIFYPSRCSTSSWAFLSRRLHRISLQKCRISRYDPPFFLSQLARHLSPAKLMTTCQHQVWYRWTIWIITPRTLNAKTKPTNDPNFAGMKGITFSFMEKIADASAMGEMYSYNIGNFVRNFFDSILSLWAYHHNHWQPFIVLGHLMLKISHSIVFHNEMKFELRIPMPWLVAVRWVFFWFGKELMKILEDQNSHLGRNHRNAQRGSPKSSSVIPIYQRLFAWRQVREEHWLSQEGSGNNQHLYDRSSRRHQPF